MQRYLKKNAYNEKHGLDKMSTITGAISYIEKKLNNDKHDNMELIVRNMRNNSQYRSISFLALSKIVAERIIK